MADDEKDTKVIVEEPEAAAGVIDGSDGLAELKRQLDAERIARADAEKRANQESQKAYQAQNYAQDSDLHLLTTAIETVKSGDVNLKREYAAAMQAQDYNRAADVQQLMAMNAAKLLHLENGKEALAAKPKLQAPRQFDPVEQLASQVSPREAAWIRTHPEFARDERMNAKLRGTYNLMQGEGFVPGTTEFFNEMESRLGMRGKQQEAPPGEDPMSEAAKPVARRTPPPSAPVSRSGAPPGQNSRTIRLSPDEVEMAKASGISEKQYYDNKVEMMKRDGRLH